MSFLYVTDMLNAVFGTQWHLPEAISLALVLAGCIAAPLTLRVRSLLPRVISTVLVLTTLSACMCL